MASLLADMDNAADKVKESVKSRKRKPAPEPDYDDGASSPIPYASSSYRQPSVHSHRASYADFDMSSDGLLDDGVGGIPSSDDLRLSPKKRMRTDISMTPAIERLGKMDVNSATSGADEYDNSFDDIDMDAFMSVDEDDLGGESSVKAKPRIGPVKMEVDASPKALKSIDNKFNAQDKKKKEDETPSWLSIYESLSTTADDSLGYAATASRSTTNPSDMTVLEEDGSLRFYWLDYLEHEGKLYFVGKVQDKKSKAWVSCCVTVENLERNLFVLSRERRVEEDEETGEMYETDVVPELTDIYNDVDRIRRKAGIKKWRGKLVKRKYAFGEKDVPKGESQWFKVVYGFDGMSVVSTIANVIETAICRASASKQHFESEHLPCLRDEYHCIRTACSQAKDHGTLLASSQGA